MTGGAGAAASINRNLARAALAWGRGVLLGSERSMLEELRVAMHCTGTRDVAELRRVHLLVRVVVGPS
jgi:isopentenyl diphosphate isomerase/L-lactate dehydrogenase-like FMN-dependent dehydrogenase